MLIHLGYIRVSNPMFKFIELKIIFISQFIGVVTQQQPHQPESVGETNCEHFIRHCDSLRCPYGLLKSYDGSCERCECEDPCLNHECQIDSKCSVDLTDHDGETVFVPVCRKFKKPGQCPRLEQSSTCEVECHDDADCRGDYKCCSAGCSNVCHSPIDERIRPTPRAPYHDPEAKSPELEEVPEENLRPVAREGGIATLRCFATGFPPPSITWKRGGIEVNRSYFQGHKNVINKLFSSTQLKTNQGRFVLSSNGDLQIVQLHRTDSGTYVCVAYNGIGNSVEREIQLTVDGKLVVNCIFSVIEIINFIVSFCWSLGLLIILYFCTAFCIGF